MAKIWYLIVPYNLIALVWNLVDKNSFLQIAENLFFISIGFLLFNQIDSKLLLCEKGLIYCDRFIKWVDVLSYEVKDETLIINEKANRKNRNIKINVKSNVVESLKDNLNVILGE
jgi:hypothetical protein